MADFLRGTLRPGEITAAERDRRMADWWDDYRRRAHREGARWSEAIRGGRAMTEYYACEAAMRAEGRRCADPTYHTHA